jgi:hypothetical protein
MKLSPNLKRFPLQVGPPPNTGHANTDTDTNAAICGALLGAAQRRAAIPVRWCMAVLALSPFQ